MAPVGAAVSLSVPAPDILMYSLTCFKLNIYFAFFSGDEGLFFSQNFNELLFALTRIPAKYMKISNFRN